MKNRIWLSLILLLLSLGLRAQTAIIHESEYPDTIRVACIGNSVTFGYGITGPGEGLLSCQVAGDHGREI